MKTITVDLRRSGARFNSGFRISSAKNGTEYLRLIHYPGETTFDISATVSPESKKTSQLKGALFDWKTKTLVETRLKSDRILVHVILSSGYRGNEPRILSRGCRIIASSSIRNPHNEYMCGYLLEMKDKDSALFFVDGKNTDFTNATLRFAGNKLVVQKRNRNETPRIYEYKVPSKFPAMKPKKEIKKEEEEVYHGN